MARKKTHALASHPAILAFVGLVTDNYELILANGRGNYGDEPEVTVDAEGCAFVRPMNPPYGTLDYVAPFVQDLERMLREAGFKDAGGRPGDYEFVGHGLKAYLENVDADRESGDPIHVAFVAA